MGDHPRRPDAVAGEAERVVDAAVERADDRRVAGRDVDRPAPGVVDPPALEPGEEAARGGGRPRPPPRRRPRRGRRSRAPATHAAAAPAERDPAVGRGAEVVEQVAGVGDALAPGPADLLEQLGHRLGDHHVARGQRQPPAQRRQRLLGPAGREDRVAGAHRSPPAVRTSTPSRLGVHARTRASARRPRPRPRSASRRSPSASRAGFTVAEPGKNAPARKIGDAQRACTSAPASDLDRVGARPARCACLDGRQPGVVVGRRGRDLEVAAAAEPGVDALRLAPRTDLVDGALRRPRDADRAERRRSAGASRAG